MNWILIASIVVAAFIALAMYYALRYPNGKIGRASCRERVCSTV